MSPRALTLLAEANAEFADIAKGRTRSPLAAAKYKERQAARQHRALQKPQQISSYWREPWHKNPNRAERIYGDALQKFHSGDVAGSAREAKVANVMKEWSERARRMKLIKGTYTDDAMASEARKPKAGRKQYLVMLRGLGMKGRYKGGLTVKDARTRKQLGLPDLNLHQYRGSA